MWQWDGCGQWHLDHRHVSSYAAVDLPTLPTCHELVRDM